MSSRRNSRAGGARQDDDALLDAARDRVLAVGLRRTTLTDVARHGPALVILDDLQWADEATLELLPALAEPLAELPVLVLAAYRSDGLPRDHLLRRARHELRRAGRLDELRLCLGGGCR